MKSKVAAAHIENCERRFFPTPFTPFPKYKALAQSGSKRLMVNDQ